MGDEMTRRTVSILALLAAMFLLAAPHADAKKLTGGGLADNIFGSKKGDKLTGKDGADTIFGKKGEDKINGGQDNEASTLSDTILGGRSKDKLDGEFGDDVIVDDDGKGGDKLIGGAGNDQLNSVDGAKDNITCGDGTDYAVTDLLDKIAEDCENIVSGSSNSFGYAVVVFNDLENNSSLSATGGPDAHFGGKGDDLLFGLGGDDWLDGGPDDDGLAGGDGNDKIFDDDGYTGSKDIIDGGNGADTIYAADGAADDINCGFGDSDNGDVVYADPEIDSLINCSLDTVIVGDGEIVDA